MAREILGATLLTMHNLHLLHGLMAEMRAAILKCEFDAWQREFRHNWGA
jgi:tRNA-guanine family transglycosylase